MRRFVVLPLIVLLAACAQSPPTAAPGGPDHCPTGRLEDRCFVPGDDCTGMVVKWIGRARHEILLQAYGFTSAPIAEALVAAKGRGVDVRAILDKSQPHAHGGKIDTLTAAGIPVLIERMPGIAHNKVLIIDGQYVETGSFNYSDSAQHRNAENALVISGCGVSDYLANWHHNADISRAYRGGEIGAGEADADGR